MSKVVSFVIVMMCAVVSVSAQASSQVRQERKHHVEDKNANLRADKMPEEVKENFIPGTAYSYPGDDFKPGVVRVGPRTTYLKEGLTTDEVVKLLGKPIATSERSEKDVVVTTCEFQRGEGRVLVAEFEKGFLVRSRIESHDGHK